MEVRADQHVLVEAQDAVARVGVELVELDPLEAGEGLEVPVDRFDLELELRAPDVILFDIPERIALAFVCRRSDEVLVDLWEAGYGTRHADAAPLQSLEDA